MRAAARESRVASSSPACSALRRAATLPAPRSPRARRRRAAPTPRRTRELSKRRDEGMEVANGRSDAGPHVSHGSGDRKIRSLFRLRAEGPGTIRLRARWLAARARAPPAPGGSTSPLRVSSQTPMARQAMQAHCAGVRPGVALVGQGDVARAQEVEPEADRRVHRGEQADHAAGHARVARVEKQDRPSMTIVNSSSSRPRSWRGPSG